MTSIYVLYATTTGTDNTFPVSAYREESCVREARRKLMQTGKHFYGYQKCSLKAREHTNEGTVVVYSRSVPGTLICVSACTEDRPGNNYKDRIHGTPGMRRDTVNLF